MQKSIKNNKGFTLVELLIVIALMGALVVVCVGPLASVYKARAKSAANEIGAMLSESKIDSLSGKTNEFHLTFDGSTFICSLIQEGSELKSENIGNKKTSIDVEGSSLNSDADKELVIKFNNQSGKVESAEYDGNNLLGDHKVEINVEYGSLYRVTIYEVTGEIEVKIV